MPRIVVVFFDSVGEAAALVEFSAFEHRILDTESVRNTRSRRFDFSASAQSGLEIRPFLSPRPGVLVSSTSPRAYIQHARFGRIFFHATSRTPRRACDLMMLDAVRPKTSAESTNCVLSLRPGDGRESSL